MRSANWTLPLQRVRGQLSRSLSRGCVCRQVYRRPRMFLLPAAFVIVVWSLRCTLVGFRGLHRKSGKNEILSQHETVKGNLGFSQTFGTHGQDEVILFRGTIERNQHSPQITGLNVSHEKSRWNVDYFAFNNAKLNHSKAFNSPPLPTSTASKGLGAFSPEGDYLQQEVNESVARNLVVRGHNSTSGERSLIQEDLVDLSDLEVKARLDLMQWEPPKLLPNFKNPCWVERSDPNDTCRKLPTFHTPSRLGGARLLCLPYFFLIGQPKCGTSDIFFRLALHPQVAPPPLKEIFWLDKRRFERGCVHINSYLDFLEPTVRRIGAFPMPVGTRLVYPLVTGDGTPDTMWDNHEWWRLPGNEKCQEPCLTNADLVHHLQPAAKLIVALRHPVDRLYSDYLYESEYLGYQPSPPHFHQEVIKELDVFRACLLRQSLRACVYNGSQENYRISKVRLRIGLYSVHLEDWLRVFPRSQFHVIKFEDYVRNVLSHLNALFTFLDLYPLPPFLTAHIATLPPVNQRSMQYRALGDMLPSTRVVLQKFYQPYNERLAELLRSSAYLWQDTSPAVT